MNAKKSARARRIIANPDYAEWRIDKIVRTIFKVTDKFYRRSDFSADAKKAHNAIVRRLRRKRGWYEDKLRNA